MKVAYLVNQYPHVSHSFIRREILALEAHGVTVERFTTDSGSAYRSHHFHQAILDAGLGHKRTRPNRPQTNGKAERFVQTSLRERAYPQAFDCSAEHSQAVRPWLHSYNRHQARSALGGIPPFTRLPKDDLLGNDS